MTLGLNFPAVSFATCHRIRFISFHPTISEQRRIAHTIALDFLMCCIPNKNWRLRLLRSMVSRSTMWISPNPVITRFFSNSHPMPPAPTIRTRDYARLLSVVTIKGTYTTVACFCHTSLIRLCKPPSDLRVLLSRTMFIVCRVPVVS